MLKSQNIKDIYRLQILGKVYFPSPHIHFRAQYAIRINACRMVF